MERVASRRASPPRWALIVGGIALFVIAWIVFLWRASAVHPADKPSIGAVSTAIPALPIAVAPPPVPVTPIVEILVPPASVPAFDPAVSTPPSPIPVSPAASGIALLLAILAAYAARPQLRRNGLVPLVATSWRRVMVIDVLRRPG